MTAAGRSALGAERHSSSDAGVDPVRRSLDRAEASGKGGEVVSHELLAQHGTVERLAPGRLGEETARDFRRAGAAITRAAAGCETVATSIGSLADDDQLGALVEGIVLGGFGFSRRSRSDGRQAPDVTLTDLGLPGDRASRSRVVEDAVTRAMASWRARSYALTPSNEKGPVQLEAWAREAADAGGLDLEVWDEQATRRGGLRWHPRRRSWLGVRRRG